MLGGNAFFDERDYLELNAAWQQQLGLNVDAWCHCFRQ
jgi:hypothetical protein